MSVKSGRWCRLVPYLVGLAGAFGGCNCGDGSLGDGGDPPEMGAPQPGGNACGDSDPGCKVRAFAPPGTPFPLQSDPAPDPQEADHGVARDPDGFLVLSSVHASYDYLWLANTDDWGIGSVSKV